ncbi:MAG: PEPxxWA-CTERM sorting domain-containing protein [Sphingomonadaceae bacterium]|uniref:PEPxxWA-CTERM sorting domain-containing protein n=1 Tax=Thermaurantiacus sp. TaxID=2820283 RepID=UPI00298EE895|nr:PEPxxWA-CTERM sorting domain-containing protein [Thermaurantiacus sp.]MCS6986146.1 PEPxxWA-CTERM sorting domain-containing protein [Sphingomonadaceae bacterium]MDW8414628.1 PEPxxWA-CTERM sorting domain-containing protein [Thermaurantiacus sp.]
MRAFFTLATLALASSAVNAGVLVKTYDMPNGSGHASGGSWNYWDLSYSGSGSKTTDGAFLSGGKGDLTDGHVASDMFIFVENHAGTGPYVGWVKERTPTLEILFTFEPSPDPAWIDTIRIHVDNSMLGGVYQPAGYRVNGVPAMFAPLPDNTIGWVTLTGFGKVPSSSSLTLALDYAPHHPTRSWIFVSEIEFLSGVIPEPQSWALMIAGFGLVGSVLRRHRARPDGWTTRTAPRT